ncbi:uncharacterized protein LAESUDRAFT_732729, partial [Laetiporus sulphureus 93-53]
HLSLTKVTRGSLEPYFGRPSEIVDVGRLFSLVFTYAHLCSLETSCMLPTQQVNTSDQK